MICELVNDDGTVTRGEQVEAFSVKHGLKQVSVADLIAYRQRKETLIEHVDSFDVETVAGKAKAHSYKLPWDPMHHLAVVFGDIRDGVDIPVRLHLESVVEDVFSKDERMTAIIQRMASEGRGAIVYLREGSVGVGRQTSRRMPVVEGEGHAEAKAREDEWLEIGLGAQILKDLGITSIKLYASRERHYVGLEGFGIQISSTEII